MEQTKEQKLIQKIKDIIWDDNMEFLTHRDVCEEIRFLIKDFENDQLSD